MADNLKLLNTSRVETKDIGQEVDAMVKFAMSKRKGFERRWYDNNFFDDGHHFRYLSRSSNKIVDLSERATIYAPQRAIPKASRQLRGIANLLVAPDYIPVVYPEKVDQSKYPPVQQMDPQSGQPTMVPNPQYLQAMKQAKEYAHKTGRWLIKEWDAQDLIEKLAHMVILTGKHSVSWMQIWPDSMEEAIKTQVYDAFDVVVMGDLTDPEDSPMIGKITKQLISKIKANPLFDQQQLARISPDNKQASSEIKDAYMNARFSNLGSNDNSATLLLKEIFIKEYLNSDNMARIRSQADGDKILKDKEEGDVVIRQVFVGGNIWLRDKYVNLPGYPFVDFRMEPGPIYSISQIERFIPINKSLDMLVSRAERYSHTMVTGSWSKKAGEQFKIDNTAGGQVIEYAATPPTQNQIAPIPQFYFELMNMMGSLIEEQGMSTSTLGKLPTGVKAHAAIESLKESEYSNLIIPTRRLKNTVKRIAEKMLDIADNSFVSPQTVYDMKDGNPQYFDIIGASALEGRKKLKVETPDGVVPIKKDYKVEIEVEQGMGYTKEGQKQAAKELGDYMVQLAQEQMISPQVVQVFLKSLLETYQFGSTADVMEALDDNDMTAQLTDQQQMQIKVAVLEALKDAGEIGPDAQKNRIMENKVGVIEALKESGLADKMSQEPQQPVKESVSINYKDAPEDVKRQMEWQAGFSPSDTVSPSGVESATKLHQAANPPEKGGNKNGKTTTKSSR